MLSASCAFSDITLRSISSSYNLLFVENTRIAHETYSLTSHSKHTKSTLPMGRVALSRSRAHETYSLSQSHRCYPTSLGLTKWLRVQRFRHPSQRVAPLARLSASFAASFTASCASHRPQPHVWSAGHTTRIWRRRIAMTHEHSN